MVKATYGQIYDALTSEFRPIDSIRKDIERDMGLSDMSIGRKILYLATLQSFWVKPINFYFALHDLREEGFVQMEYREFIEGKVRKELTYARKVDGKEFTQGKRDKVKMFAGLEIIFGF
jgi:hypothetical protein